MPAQRATGRLNSRSGPSWDEKNAPEPAFAEMTLHLSPDGINSPDRFGLNLGRFYAMLSVGSLAIVPGRLELIFNWSFYFQPPAGELGRIITVGCVKLAPVKGATF